MIDAAHPAALARFWAEALVDYEVAPYDEAELARLREMGIDSPEDDPTVLLEPCSGEGPRIFVQLVPEVKTVKNRLHLDVEPAPHDFDAELERLLRLGATVVVSFEGWTTLADPEGNEFCLMRGALSP